MGSLAGLGWPFLIMFLWTSHSAADRRGGVVLWLWRWLQTVVCCCNHFCVSIAAAMPWRRLLKLDICDTSGAPKHAGETGPVVKLRDHQSNYVRKYSRRVLEVTSEPMPTFAPRWYASSWHNLTPARFLERRLCIMCVIFMFPGNWRVSSGVCPECPHRQVSPTHSAVHDLHDESSSTLSPALPSSPSYSVSYVFLLEK